MPILICGTSVERRTRGEPRGRDNDSDERIGQRWSTAATRRQAIVGVAITFGGLTLGSTEAWASPGEEIPIRGIDSPGASVQSQPVSACMKRDGRKPIRSGHQLSGVMKSMSLGNKPTEINRELGGAFAALGGYITGRQVDLVPNERIVQAWRGKLGSGRLLDCEV